MSLDLEKSIMICIPVWNRKKVTSLVLKNIFSNKRSIDELVVYNDWSTQYDNSFLEPLCNTVIKLDASSKRVVKNEQNINGMGVQHLRWYQFRSFLKQTRHDFLYLTDNDALHDPDFVNRLLTLYGKWKLKDGRKLPICLYNTIFHSDPKNLIVENDDIIMRKTAPGISMLFDRNMVEIIVSELDKHKKHFGSDPDYGWDYFPNIWLNRPFITSKQSYIEHFGADKGSLHTPEGLWDRDRAINPTPFLIKNRDSIIEYLESDIDKEEYKYL